MSRSLSDLIKRQATPYTTGLFLVSAVSGLALFLHVGTSWFHAMHEILSLVLLLPVALHMWRNWPALVGHFRRPAMAVALAVSVALAGAFAFASGSGASGGRPPFAVFERLQAAPVAAVAPALGLDAATTTKLLVAAGLPVPADGESLAALAGRAGVPVATVLTALTASP